MTGSRVPGGATRAATRRWPAEVSGPLPDGECVTTRLADLGLRIDRADPRILIAAPLLAEVYAVPIVGVSLGRPQPDAPVPGASRLRGYWEGALLKICGVNRTVIYRIGEYLPGIDCYIGEWPD